MLMQLMMVAAIHSYDFRFMVKELLWTLTGMRCGLLHKRVLTKEESRGNVDVIAEAVSFKGIEVACESIP
jgi:hypothetical protein